MEMTERLQRLHEHIQDHPSDYQSVIAELKLRSKFIEHQGYLRQVEKLKRVAEIRERKKRHAEQNE